MRAPKTLLSNSGQSFTKRAEKWQIFEILNFLSCFFTKEMIENSVYIQPYTVNTLKKFEVVWAALVFR